MFEAETQVACHDGGLWGKGAQKSCCELIVVGSTSVPC
jgi:hypothetical protein